GSIASSEECVGGRRRWGRSLSWEVRHDVLRVCARDGVEAIDERRLARVHRRDEEALDTRFTTAASRHEHAVDMPDCAVERELAEKGGASRPRLPYLCERDRHCDGKVEPAALFAHLGRCEVDSQARAGKVESAVLDRGADALTRFLHRSGREPDEVKVRLAIAAVGLDFDAPRFETHEHARMDGGEHAATVCEK